MFAGWLRRLCVALQAKVAGMRKSAVKDQLYGGIMEMMQNRSLFYRSDIGREHEHSRWTEEGREELLAFVMAQSRKMLIAADAELEAHAKEMTFQALKKQE